MDTITTDNSKSGYTLVLQSPYIMTGKEYYDRYTSGTGVKAESCASDVPAKIQEMLGLYEYGDRSFLQKCRVFVRQGMFMKDYEDDALWYGDLRRYFPVYHDLNIRQLRGYFAWRTKIRKGGFERTCETFAYLYLYELLNGIGTSSVSESLEKLEEFYVSYIEAGMGDPPLKKNLRRWIREFAVINDLPEEYVQKYADADAEAAAHAVAVLHDPGDFSDEEVFDALTRFSYHKIAPSPVVTKYQEKGKHLFAEVWRHLPDKAFSACFGEPRTVPWHPLAGAIYLEQREAYDRDYALDSLRSYSCRDGVWQETEFSSLSRNTELFCLLMHAIDMKLRRLLKTGHYLRMKQNEEQAAKFADQAFSEMRRLAAEAARPKVRIDLSGLDRIREDAGTTRDSLLTDEEMYDEEVLRDEENLCGEEEARDSKNSTADTASCGILDPVQTALIKALLQDTGNSATDNKVSDLITENHLMPEIMADSINEALFDEIGDNVIECENDRLSLVPDYTEDLCALIGGES